jgi:hypothetical protein
MSQRAYELIIIAREHSAIERAIESLREPNGNVTKKRSERVIDRARPGRSAVSKSNRTDEPAALTNGEIEMKSLMLATACFYMNPTVTPPAQPNDVIAMQSVPEVLKQAFAMQPGTRKEIAVSLENGLCAGKVVLESVDASALDAFVSSEAYKNFRPDDEE